MQNSQHQFLTDQDEQIIKLSNIQPHEQAPQGQNIVINVVSQKNEMNQDVESEVYQHRQDKPKQDAVVLDQINNDNRNIQITTIPQDPTQQLPNNQEKIIDSKAGKIDQQMKYEMPQEETKQTNQIGQDKLDQWNIIQKDKQKRVDKLSVVQQKTIFEQPKKIQIDYQMDLNLKSTKVARCQYCNKPLKLIQDHKISGNTFLCGFIICLVLTPLFSWIPFVSHDCQDTVHACSSCGQTIFIVKEYKIC